MRMIHGPGYATMGEPCIRLVSARTASSRPGTCGGRPKRWRRAIGRRSKPSRSGRRRSRGQGSLRAKQQGQRQCCPAQGSLRASQQSYASAKYVVVLSKASLRGLTPSLWRAGRRRAMHRGDRERFSAQMTSRGGISDCATDCMVGSRLELEAGGATPPASLPGITPLGELPCFPICSCEEFDTAHVSDVAEEELVAGAGMSGCFTFVMRPVLRMLAALAMLGGADASRHDNEVATCQ